MKLFPLIKKDLESQRRGFVKAALVKIGDEFDVFADHDIKDAEVKICKNIFMILWKSIITYDFK